MSAYMPLSRADAALFERPKQGVTPPLFSGGVYNLFVRLAGPRSEIEVLLDSEPLYRWQGLSHRLSRNPRFRNMPPGQIGFGAHYIGWWIKSAKVRLL